MGWNPCCCWKLKDATIVIGIWSAIFAVVQLGIFGWQMAAIKYERDRAANTLLPNYNTYGRFDIPSYYESYWQSPEERYYTGLFVVQVLCLIVSFFLLFASVALIYGVHAWSRFLVWPWFPCMIASVLTSTAYCVTWWAGDVRDYWLVLTILEILCVFLNVYLFVVVLVFYNRMNRELEYYEGKRKQKYDRFSIPDPSPPLDPDPDLGPYPRRSPWEMDRWMQENQMMSGPGGPMPPPDPYFDGKHSLPKRRYDRTPMPDDSIEPGFTQLQHSHSVPSFFDDSFQDVPREVERRRSRRRHRSNCRHCERRHRRHHSSSHHHRKRRNHRTCDCSDAGSSEITESTESRRYRDDGSSSDSEDRRYNRHRRRSSSRRVSRLDLRNTSTQAELFGAAMTPITPPAPPTPVTVQGGMPMQFNPLQGAGITIPPQQIVIPPAPADDPASNQPRKYDINWEMTIQYDPATGAVSQRPATGSARGGTPSATVQQPTSIMSNV